MRIQLNSDRQVKSFLFINETAIKDTRLWPEALKIDATYKTNTHRFSLINIVETSHVSTIKNGDHRLQKYSVTAAFVDSEIEESYQWVLQELKEVVWPSEENVRLPSVIITDNERVLRNAIGVVFPESQHLLCYANGTYGTL